MRSRTAADGGPFARARPERPEPGRGEYLLAGAIALAALLLRLPFLGRSSLWLDEMWSLGTARLPWRSLLSVVLHRDSNASLYYALLHVWMRMDASVVSTRLLSVLAGAATVFVVYLVGRRLAGARVGLIASLLVAVNGLHVQQSQEARAYSLVVLLATTATLLFIEGVEERRVRSWFAYTVTSVLAVYAHVFAVLVIAAHFSSLLFLRRRQVPWARVLASAAAIGALVSPVAVLLRARMGEPNAPLAWVAPTSAAAIKDLFWRLSGTPFIPDPQPVPLLKVYFVICAVAFVAAARVWRATGRSLSTWRLGLVFSWLFVPIALAAAVSVFKPVFVAKFLMVCLPALALLVAIGLDSVRWSWVRATAAVAVAVMGILVLPRYYRFRTQNVEWQAATEHILSRARPGDAAVFFVAPGRLLFDYYRGATERPAPAIEVAYPEAGDPADPESLDYLPPMRRDLIERLTSRNPRVWLVLHHDTFAHTTGTGRQLEELLASGYGEPEEHEFLGNGERVRLLLYAAQGRGR